MSENYEFANRINTLKQGVESFTGESYDDLTIAVQALKDACADPDGPVESGQCGDNAFWELYPNGLLVISGSGPTNYTEFSGTFSPFRRRKDITVVVVRDGITTIEESMFESCSLAHIILPSTIESIRGGAFTDCNNLEEITFPSGCTTIEEYVFVACRRLSRIVIPDSLVSIGTGAFLLSSGEYAPLDIFYTGTKAQWDNISISEESNGRLSTATLHCEYDPNADTVDGYHLEVRSDGSNPPYGTKGVISFVYTKG